MTTIDFPDVRTFGLEHMRFLFFPQRSWRFRQLRESGRNNIQLFWYFSDGMVDGMVMSYGQMQNHSPRREHSENNHNSSSNNKNTNNSNNNNNINNNNNNNDNTKNNNNSSSNNYNNDMTF